jgi:hypothetical protein
MTKQLCPKCGRPIGYGAIAGQAHAAKYHTEPTPSAPSRSGPRWEAMGLRIGQLVAVAVLIGAIALIILGLIREAGS